MRSCPEGHHGLLCCAANRTAQRISIRVTFRLYASWFSFLRALHLNIFEQPSRFFNDPIAASFHFKIHVEIIIYICITVSFFRDKE